MGRNEEKLPLLSIEKGGKKINFYTPSSFHLRVVYFCLLYRRLEKYLIGFRSRLQLVIRLLVLSLLADPAGGLQNKCLDSVVMWWEET